MGGIDASYSIPKKTFCQPLPIGVAQLMKHKMLTEEESSPVDNFVEKRKTPKRTVESS